MQTTTDSSVQTGSREGLRVKDEYLQSVLEGKSHLLFDGGMGTMVQRRALVQPGEAPDLLCLSHPDDVAEIHRAYVEAGSQVVTTNTFGANRLKLGEAVAVADLYAAAVSCARASGARYVAADIGPTGELLDPYGDLEYEEALDLFSEQASAAQAAGADIIIVETMADMEEARAAVTAALENTALPVFATMTFGAHGRTLMGNDPAEAARLLDSLGASALGINCSLGPAEIAPFVAQMLEATSKPVIVQANAGLPKLSEGETVYSILPAEYAEAVDGIVRDGATIIGGCCGTDPDYIRELAAMLEKHGWQG